MEIKDKSITFKDNLKIALENIKNNINLKQCPKCKEFSTKNLGLYMSLDKNNFKDGTTFEGKSIYEISGALINTTIEYKKPYMCVNEKAPINFSMGNYNLVMFKEEIPLPKYLLKNDIRKKYEVISSWKLYELPHCCAIIVSCDAWVNFEYRKLGIGTILNKLRQDIGKELGYTTMLCTDVINNEAQRQILAKNGWTDIYHLTNKRTKNKLAISVKDL